MLYDQHNNDGSTEEEQSNSYHEVEHKKVSDNLDLVPILIKVKQIILLRHHDFVKLLNEFNATLDIFTNDEPFFLQFTIVPQTDSSILWKALIRIQCSKISRVNQSRINQAILNLQQFLSVHQSLCQQISTLQRYSNGTLYNSSAGNENTSSFSTAKLSFSMPNDNECCICMDREPNLVLPCTHRFCDQCFQQWSSQKTATSSHTCPLCRVDINRDSGFVLAEMPPFDKMKKMLTESILALPNDLRNRRNEDTSMIRSDHE